MVTYIFDFDRVIYNTPVLIARAREKSEQILGCNPIQYDEQYKIWSDQARATKYIDSMPLERQQKFVSWMYGFVPFLAGELKYSDKTTTVLQAIHKECLSQRNLYKDAITMVEMLPKEHVFIFTAGGELDQRAKLRASGIYDLLPTQHIKIVPAKTRDIFQELLNRWHVRSEDRLIHINDRLSELRELHSVHPHTESLWATWAWPDAETPHDIPLGIRRVDTVRDCHSLLIESRRSQEGPLVGHTESQIR